MVKWLACLPLMGKVVGSYPGQVIKKIIIKNGTNFLPAWHAGTRVGV